MTNPPRSHSSDPADFDTLVRALAGAARTCHQRRALVLAGTLPWGIAQARRALEVAGLGRALWLSTSRMNEVWSLPHHEALGLLGRQVDALVFDAHSGFDPDAFGAATGTIEGGGLLVLLSPALDEWPSFPDPEYRRIAVAPHPPQGLTGRFLRRLVEVLRTDQAAVIVEQHGPVPPPPAPTTARAADTGQPSDTCCRTEDQARAVEAVVKVVTGQRRRPVVLISDRGRGKSSALGIAAARLLKQGLQHIVVTGPRLDAVAPVFERAGAALPGARVSRAAVHLGSAVLEYAAPDELVRTRHSADLVLVDEAAAIPTPLLERLLAQCPRIAFATTVHGYEGTGRGFALRFKRVLEERSRGWRTIQLETPIRWAPDDPVERLVFRALSLDAAPAPDEALVDARPESCRIERLDRDALAADEALLSQVFGLLVLAHYRTRPYDLRHLLDGPNLAIHAAYHAGNVVATAVVALEGGFDAATARAVRDGTRRPRGHLLPEAIAAHLGLDEAAMLRCARIMRVAVHPAAARRGIGSQLLDKVVADAAKNGLDFVGSSFGANAELLDFWSASGFVPVRLGATRGASSGAHSAILLRGLSKAGMELADRARDRFLRHLSDQLTETLRDIEPELVPRLLQGGEITPEIELDAADKAEVEAFSRGQRVYEDCLGPLRRQVLLGLADPGKATRLNAQQRAALVLKVAQHRSWAETAAALELPGRAQVMEVLRAAVQTLIATVRPSST